MSKFSQASDAIKCRDEISAPGQPEAIEIESNSVTLQWKQPDFNGGAKITGKLKKIII